MAVAGWLGVWVAMACWVAGWVGGCGLLTLARCRDGSPLANVVRDSFLPLARERMAERAEMTERTLGQASGVR